MNARLDQWRLRSWLSPNGGWSLLLPDVEMSHLVVVDTAPGHAVVVAAERCERLTVVPARAEDAPALEQVAARLQCDHVTVLAPLTDGPVDSPIDASVVGIIVNLLPEDDDAAVPSGAWRTTLVRWLCEARAVIAADAFVWLAAGNACSYRRLRRPGPRPLLGFGGGSAARLLREAGFNRPRVYPLLTHDGRVYEVLQGTGYRSVSGRPNSLADRVRQVLLGRWGSRRLAPAYGCVAFSGAPQRSQLDAMLCASGDVEGVPAADRLLIQPDKALVFVHAAAHEKDAVLVVPFTDLARRRRRNERRVLRRLSAQFPELTLVPRHLAHGSHREIGWELIECVDGIAVDEPVADLEELTERAHDFLLRLHDTTRHDVVIDDSSYHRFFGTLFRRAEQRHPGARRFLGQLEADVRDVVMGSRLPSVWMHGDFKIENVLLDATTRQPRGVIDWELSQVRGLPLLDLLYLLTYNHMLRRSRRFDQAYVEVTVCDGWLPREWDLLREYLHAVPAGAAMAVALEAMLLVHALALRFTYDMDHPPHRARVLEMIACARARVAGFAAVSRDTRIRPTGTEG